MPEPEGERYYYADGKKVGLTTSNRFMAVKTPEEGTTTGEARRRSASRSRARRSSSCRSTTWR